MMPEGKFPLLELLTQKGKRICVISGSSDFQNAHGQRSDAGRSSGRKMVLGPYALRCEALATVELLCYRLTVQLPRWHSQSHPVFPGSVLLHMCQVQLWCTKHNVARGKSELRECNKQETNTLPL